MVIEYLDQMAQAHDMTQFWRICGLTALISLTAGSLDAACYADYKAKQDNPLRLHYGVVELPERACSNGRAAQVIARRIGRDGWQLLNVLGLFDASGLEARRDSAGQYFLRY